MNKEEQIEEMAEIIKADYKEWLDVTGVIPAGTTYYNECLGGGRDSAEKLYAEGYRKADSMLEKTTREILGEIEEWVMIKFSILLDVDEKAICSQYFKNLQLKYGTEVNQ